MKRALPIALLPLLLLLLPSRGFAQWKKLTAYSSSFFNEVFFLDNSNGWITQFNTTILHTTDGGNSWQTGTLSGGSGSFNRDICFVTSSVGFISGDDGIWKSTDGGANWTNITPAVAIVGSTCNWFIDGSVGVYGFGNCADSTVTFCRTLNGGSTWTSVTYTHTVDVAVGGMTYRNGAFYAAGGNGKTWRSLDSGATWTMVVDGSAGWQEDMVSSSSGGLFTASANGSSCGSIGGGKVMRSNDGGLTWSASNFPSVVMWGVTMYSSSEGWACGDGGHAYKTTDGGATWNESSCGMSSSDRLDDIHFTDATHGWAVGDGIYKFVGLYYATRPDTIDFGDVLVGSTSADSLARIKAIGPDGSVTGRALAGRDPTQFGATGGLGGFTMTVCQETTTPVHFSPTSEGLKIARVDFIVPGQPDTPRVYLKGRGVAPHIVSSPTLVFDTLQCDVTGLDTLVLTNSGTYVLRLTGASFENMTGGSFQLVSPSIPADIPPGTSRNVVVRVTAGGPGAVNGQVALTSNDLDPAKVPWRVRLTAYKRTVLPRLAPDTLLVIPSGPINTAMTACLDYVNAGDGPQTVESVTLAAGGGAISNVPPVTNAVVQIGGRQQLCFQVLANDTGWVQRRFRVRTLPCGIDTFITVKYYATNPIIGSPTDRRLSDLRCGRAVLDTILVTNGGNAPLVLDRPYFSGPDGAEFEVVGPTSWPDTVPVKGSLRVIVRQRPGGAAGTRKATLIIPNNDLYPKKNPWTIELSGRVDVDSLDLSRRTIELGDICRGGEKRIETILLTNVSAAAGTVTAVTPLAPAGSLALLVDPTGHLLPAGARDSLRLAIAPTATGDFNAKVEILFGDCDRRDTVTVTGRVTGYDLKSDPFSFGLTRIGTPIDKGVTVTNKGASTATVIGLRIEPSTAPVTIIGPMPTFPLPPGTPVPILLRFQPADSLPLNARLILTVADPCGDSIVIPLDGRGLPGDLLPTRGEISLGSLYSCDNGIRIDSAVIRNLGHAPLAITGASFAASPSHFTLVALGDLPKDVPPGDSISVKLGVTADFTGTIIDTLLIATSDPGGSVIRIPITARRERVELAATDTSGGALPRIAFPTLASCRDERVEMVRLVNNGTVADTVALSVGSAAAKVLPATLVLEPGADTVVAVTVKMSIPGILQDTLRAGSRPCDIDLRIPIDATFRSVATTLTSHDFQGVNMARFAEETTPFANTGEVDQTIEAIWIEAPTNGFTIVGSYVGTTVTAGGSLPIRVRFAPGSEGGTSATLVIVTGEPCHDTIRATLLGSGIRSNVNVVTRSIAYGARPGCADSCATITVEGTGPKPVTITDATISGGAPGIFRIDPPLTGRMLQPNENLELTICFDPARAGALAQGMLTIATDDSAQPTILVRLSGARSPGISAPSSVDLGGLTVGARKDTVLLIANKGSVPVTLDSLGLPDGYEGALPVPSVIAPGDTLRLSIRYAPDSAGRHDGRLLLRTMHPCVDSLAIALAGDASGEERHQVRLTAGRSTGRWGTMVTLPVTITSGTPVPMDAIDLKVSARPTMLDPRALRASAAGQPLHVERIGYDAATGDLTLRIHAPDGSAALPTEMALEIDYMVLRGDATSTPIVPALAAPVPPGLDALASNGLFTLEDICDAYGRLLTVTGNIDLKPATPNPARGRTSFELEVPFNGPVRFAIFDDRGVEVLRPIDDVLPAGRMILPVDLATLPSGVYSCRLQIGLQSLIQRLVVVR